MLLSTSTWFVWNQQQTSTVAPAPPAEVAAEAPPPPEPLPPPNLLALLHDAAAVPDPDGAYAQLFSLWNARYVAGTDDACVQAGQQGLECLDESGGLEALRRYNRPAMLQLTDDAGAMHQVVVTHLGQSTAQLLLGEEEHEVPLSELEPRWNGNFLLLWKPSRTEPRELSLGMSGEPVRNLRLRLMRALGIEPEQVAPEEILSNDFDESLQLLVLEFQRTNGLAQDGVAGSRTRALLDTQLADADTPLLSLVIK
jgi:general secretion pathway protein A